MLEKISLFVYFLINKHIFVNLVEKEHLGGSIYGYGKHRFGSTRFYEVI